MSNGNFQIAKYETDLGLVVRCKIQPESLTLTLGSVTNAGGSGTLTPGAPSARVGGGKRQIGINARTVTVKTTAAGTGATAGITAGRLLTIPVFLKASWDAYTDGDEGTYQGIPVVYAGHRDETVN